MPEIPTTTFASALALHQQGQFQAAEQQYCELINTSEPESRVYTHLINVLLQQQKVEKAMHWLKQGLQDFPVDPDLLLTSSAIAFNTGQIAESMAQARKVLDLAPHRLEAWVHLGNLLMQQQASTEALQLYQRAIQVHPMQPDFHFNLGYLYAMQGQTDAAIQAYEKTIELAPDSFGALQQLGYISLQLNRYEDAIKYYRQALAIKPDLPEVKKQLGMALHFVGQIEAAQSLYKELLQQDENNVELLTLLANAHRDLDEGELAMENYQKVLSLDPQNVTAKHNVDRMQSLRIPQWHFDMLADQARNDAYDAAIRKSAPGRSVLDIGTGSGLLAMMAARAGATSVTACEMSAPIAQAAQQILDANNMADKVQLHNKKSTKLKVGEEMSAPADLLVSEILDVGLLGEGVIPSLRHARENLLSPDAKLIPAAAQVKGYLFHSEHHSKINPIKHISGFDLSSFNQFRDQGVYIHAYTRLLPHESMSDVIPIWSIDFYQLPPAAAETQPNLHQIPLTATQDGIIHGIFFWFDLDLDEEIKLSTGPEGEMIHWGQAAFFFDEPLEVKAGEALTLILAQSDMRLLFSIKKADQN